MEKLAQLAGDIEDLRNELKANGLAKEEAAVEMLIECGLHIRDEMIEGDLPWGREIAESWWIENVIRTHCDHITSSSREMRIKFVRARGLGVCTPGAFHGALSLMLPDPRRLPRHHHNSLLFLSTIRGYC